jgi:phage tail-like protein
MSAAAETIDPPFTAFSFEVLLTLASPIAGIQAVCEGAFSECDGLALEMEPKSVTQGGANDSVTHLIGPTRPGQITLRRGMTTTAHLWAWMAAAGVPGKQPTADGVITMFDAAHQKQARFLLSGCLPVRLRGPALNAQTGLLAIEELGLAVGHLVLEGAVPSAGFGVSASFGASAGIGFSAGASAGAGAQVSGGLGLSGQLGGTFSASASASAGASFGGG